MEIQKYTNIVLFQAFAHLKKECKDGFLGILWWVIDPLIYMAAFYSIFALGLRGRGPEYAPFLLCGLIPWKWFASSVNRSTVSIKRNAKLIKQVYLPKSIFPLVDIARNTFKFFISFCILFVFLTIFWGEFNLFWFNAFYLVVVQFFLILSVGFFLASIHPFVPDIRIVVENLTMLLFFISGIFFDIDKFSPEIRKYFLLNPQAVMIKSFRTVFIDATHPPVGSLLYVVGFSVVFFSVGLFMLKKYDRHYAKIV